MDIYEKYVLLIEPIKDRSRPDITYHPTRSDAISKLAELSCRDGDSAGWLILEICEWPQPGAEYKTDVFGGT